FDLGERDNELLFAFAFFFNFQRQSAEPIVHTAPYLFPPCLRFPDGNELIRRTCIMQIHPTNPRMKNFIFENQLCFKPPREDVSPPLHSTPPATRRRSVHGNAS